MSPRTLPEARFAFFTAVVALLATLFLVTNAQADSELEPCADTQAPERAVNRLVELHSNARPAQSARHQGAEPALRAAADAIER